MKNIILILSIFLIGLSGKANSPESRNLYNRGYDGSAYIFVEGDVEFSIFPDGQFDFIYVGPQKANRVTIASPHVNISFNSGYNYDAYVQYDMYGAVIQVENVPIFYDYYGRIVRAGNVDISYNNRRLVRVGGLYVFYNPYGRFSHCTGIINRYNPYYLYRPWHIHYARPYIDHVIVYDYPYRRYYNPVRYSYRDHVQYYKNRGRVSYQNGRRSFYRPGSRVHRKDGRISKNDNFDPNRRNTLASSHGRNSRTLKKVRETTARNNSSIVGNTRRSKNVRSNKSGRRIISSRNDRSVRTPIKTPSHAYENNRVRSNRSRIESKSQSISQKKRASVTRKNERTSAAPTRKKSRHTTQRRQNSSIKSTQASRHNSSVRASGRNGSRHKSSLRGKS